MISNNGKNRAYCHLASETLSAFHVFQPIFSSATGQVWANETLTRVVTEEGHVASYLTLLDGNIPDDCLIRLDRAGIREAARISKALSIRLTVNICPRVVDDELLESLAGLVSTGEVNPALMVLELTEHYQGHHAELVRFTKVASELGFTVAIDDFGDAYSGLSYLKGLSNNGATIAKIPRQYIQHAAKSASEHRFYCELVRFLKNCGLRVVTEGIETPEDQDIATAAGSDYLQGYLLGMPGEAPVR